MVIYEHTQRAHLIIWIAAAAIIVFLLAALMINQPYAWIALAIPVILLAVVAWLFSSLTVTVAEKELRWYFGPGFWNKAIARDDIQSSEAVRTKWWYGWGIRYTPKGWLYNVSGFDAVAITEGSGKTTLIGTDRPQELVAALNQ